MIARLSGIVLMRKGRARAARPRAFTRVGRGSAARHAFISALLRLRTRPYKPHDAREPAFQGCRTIVPKISNRQGVWLAKCIISFIRQYDPGADLLEGRSTDVGRRPHRGSCKFLFSALSKLTRY